MQDADRESFEAWARSRQQRLVRVAYLLTGDFQRAEDLVQEALVKAALRWPALAQSNPDAWVRTVLYRDHISWWRRHRREPDLSTDQPHTTAFGPDRLVMRAALQRLTTRQRAVLVLRYLEDLSLVDTAEVLGITVGSVKKHASVALNRLRVVAPELEDLMEERR
jgi:RNA polymerase sigma-70 factor (sigma-E family)